MFTVQKCRETKESFKRSWETKQLNWCMPSWATMVVVMVAVSSKDATNLFVSWQVYRRVVYKVDFVQQ